MDAVLAIVTDLFFQSRISAAARAVGRTVRFTGPDRLPLDFGPPGIALVDLDATGDVLAAIRQLAASGCQVIAFGPHVDTERRKAARNAGASRVLAKSKFVTDLPRIIGGSSVTEATTHP